MSGLTQREADCLQSIIRLTTADGVSPEYDEIRADMGLSSKSQVHRLVTMLVERGYVSRRHRAARSLQVLRDPTANARADAIMDEIIKSDAGYFLGEHSRECVRACIIKGLAQ